MESSKGKENEESPGDWVFFFELYELIRQRVEAREEKMRESVRKVGIKEDGKHP